VIDYIADYERRLEGAEYFDEAHVRALVARIVDRTNDVAASMTNHALAEEGELARGIPQAELLPLAGVGHQVPPRAWWTSVIAAMLRHTSG
jgi:hypothetical protein